MMKTRHPTVTDLRAQVPPIEGGKLSPPCAHRLFKDDENVKRVTLLGVVGIERNNEDDVRQGDERDDGENEKKPNDNRLTLGVGKFIRAQHQTPIRMVL